MCLLARENLRLTCINSTPPPHILVQAYIVRSKKPTGGWVRRFYCKPKPVLRAPSNKYTNGAQTGDYIPTSAAHVRRSCNAMAPNSWKSHHSPWYTPRLHCKIEHSGMPWMQCPLLERWYLPATSSADMSLCWCRSGKWMKNSSIIPTFKKSERTCFETFSMHCALLRTF